MPKLNLTGFNAEYKFNDKKLKILRPIIEQWLKILRDFTEEGEYKDAMYFYNERSTVSSFAGAIWRCGGYAQEEYIAEKGEGKEKSKGRIDLFFNFAHTDVIVEAKQKWLYLYENNKKNIEKNISDSLDEAISDITRTKEANEYGNLNLAISFIIPYWEKGTKQKDNIKLIKNAVKNIDTSMYAIFESKKDIISNDNTAYNMCIAVCKNI